MSRIDYEELYEVLYNMTTSRTLTELSKKQYWSISKTSKIIKFYEKKLKIQLYIKNQSNILSVDGEKLFLKIKSPLEQLKKAIMYEDTTIGIDENLIEDKLEINFDFEKQYMNSQKLIDRYNAGKLNTIVISSDYEEMFQYTNKKFIKTKDVYFIKNKKSKNKKVYASEAGCTITKKLEVSGIHVDEYLTQTIAIQNAVRAGLGEGYTFGVEALNSQEIKKEKCEDLKIYYFLYSKYN